MKESIVRGVYFGALIACVLLFIGLIVDSASNDGALFTPILIGFIVAILALVALFFIPSDDSTVATRAQSDYPGDVHEVVDLEGIGPTYAKKLHASGIHNSQQMLFAGQTTVARITGARPKVVGRWFAMAQLIKVNGIGPQFAEVLARIDVTGIDDLATRNARVLTDGVRTYLDGLKTTVTGRRPGERTIGKWITAANDMEKAHIDLESVQVRALGSRAAKAGAA